MICFANLDNISQVEKEGVEGLIIKPYTVKELRQLYNGVSHKTLLKWLQPFNEEIGERNGRFYSVPQVEIIFLRLGLPYTISKKD